MKYSVRAEGGDAFVLACDLEGFFVGHYSFDDYGALHEAEDSRLTFRLVRPTVKAPLDTLREDIEVLVLDAEGQPMGRYSLWDAKLMLGGVPESLVVTALTQLPPHAESRGLWDRFRVSEPQKGEWRAIPVGSREGWLEVAMLRHAESAAKGTHPASHREVVMEGDDIKDVASLFCAIGEAFRGPGGYLGQNFTALEESLGDYLRGAQVRLIWRDMSVASSALSAVIDIAGEPVSKFDWVLRILSRKHVDVVPG